MRLRLERIPEKDQEIDLAIDDHRANLLVTAQRAALQLMHLEPQLALQYLAGRACGVQLVMGQQHLIELGPF